MCLSFDDVGKWLLLVIVVIRNDSVYVSDRSAALLEVKVVLSVQDVVLQSPRQRQEAHEDRWSETKKTETTTNPQAAEMLQTANVLWGGGGRMKSVLEYMKIL